MRKIFNVLIVLALSFFMVGCIYSKKSLENASLTENSLEVIGEDLSKDYSEALRFKANEVVDFDINVKSGKVKIALYSEDNTEVYSGNLNSGKTNFEVNIIEEGTYNLRIEAKKFTGTIEIKPIN